MQGLLHYDDIYRQMCPTFRASVVVPQSLAVFSQLGLDGLCLPSICGAGRFVCEYQS
jgi:hypothetical protein